MNHFETYKNVVCVAPFSSLHLSNNSYVCCAIDSKVNIPVNDTKDINWHFENTNLNLRKDFIEYGLDFLKYKDCNRCSSRRDNSQHIDHNSKANPDLNYIDNPQLTNLHIKFSNSCNLACRTCDSLNSNLLHKENATNGLLDITNKSQKNGVIQNVSRDSELYKSILENLEKLEVVWFSGGEPLLHEEVWEILDILYEKGYSKNIVFRANTNGTIKLTDRRINILKSFKELELHISMDGFGKYAEYIRTGIVWDKWWENLLTYQNSFDPKYITINITVSVYNVHILDQCHDIFVNNGFNIATNIVFYPPALSIINLNQTAKNYLNEKYKNTRFENILHLLNHDRNLNHTDCIKYIDRKDDYVLEHNLHKNYRPFREIDPEWYAIIKD